jgi:hypothetical protein
MELKYAQLNSIDVDHVSKNGIDVNLTSTDGNKLLVSLTPASLQQLINTLIDISFGLGQTRHPEGPVALDDAMRRYDLFRMTPATGLAIQQMSDDPNDMGVYVRFWETEIGFRLDSRNLLMVANSLDERGHQRDATPRVQ